MNSKKSLRHSLRHARRSLTRAQQQFSSAHLKQHLLRTRWFKRSRAIAFYWPADGEISPLFLLRSAWDMGKCVYLPVIRGESLMFRLYRRGDRLYRNRYGIPEPGINSPAQTLDQLDLVLVPLVAFDTQGNRLGMGAGFYDRCFSKIGDRPWRIGVAHEFQKISHVPRDAWDKPLHGVVTNRGCYRFK